MQCGATSWNMLEKPLGVWLVDPFIFNQFHKGTGETSKKSPGIDG